MHDGYIYIVNMHWLRYISRIMNNDQLDFVVWIPLIEGR